jgi:hypothetical protein
MFEDITTKDMTLDEIEVDSAYALLLKYVVMNIDTINGGNLKYYVKYWFDGMKDDGVNEEKLIDFKKELVGYIPDAVH